jgi:hypothetical protein
VPAQALSRVQHAWCVWVADETVEPVQQHYHSAGWLHDAGFCVTGCLLRGFTSARLDMRSAAAVCSILGRTCRCCIRAVEPGTHSQASRTCGISLPPCDFEGTLQCALA